MKSLPARPSLESLRKQAKKLARDIAAGDSQALARARAQLPNVDLPLTQRNAQLVIAREYGFPGWQDLTGEVSKRVGNGLEWAAAQAHHAIHNHDVERLKQLLAAHPALLSWQNDDDKNGLLGFATGAYGDAGTPEREGWFTRMESAELLIDAGAVVTPDVREGLIRSRAKGLLALFQRKGLLPHTLKFDSALGDLDAVRASLAKPGNDLSTVNEAFFIACSFGHEGVASVLVERSIALDPELGQHVDGSVGRAAFIKDFIEHGRVGSDHAARIGPWRVFAMNQVQHALHERDLTAFVRGLQREPWLLGEDSVDFQRGLIENLAYMHFEGAPIENEVNDREAFIRALFDLDPAILRQQPRPPAHAITHAIEYGNTYLMPLLTRIWPLPDDLPHAAAMGDLTRVKQWFDDSGASSLIDLGKQYPYTDQRAQDLHWNPRTTQQVLDVSLAYAVINRHFDVADFLLEHGADINTNWNSHEPASIMHHLVFEDNYESMQYLVDRGIDLTIKDYRWDSTAYGWALYAKRDEQMAQWLADAETRRGQIKA